jgi:2-dehydro-3-deoxyglucarate aldolase/4-hydroxy-2-oxoheptanedioate aldolase
MRINRVKQALQRGDVQLGCIVSQLGSPEVVGALAAAGFDWVFFDGEHGAFDWQTIQLMTRAALRLNLCPIVRVADVQYALVARALDCGAQGVILPRVESPQVLETAIGWTRFPPMGSRGYGLSPAHLEYEPVTIASAAAHVNEHVMVIVQIETKPALDRIDELLSVPRVDAVLIGPADLSVSLGVPGEFEHPTFVAAVDRIRESCTRQCVVPGMHFRTAALAREWRDRGIRFVSCGTEVGFLFEKAKETVAGLSPARRLDPV